MNPHACGGWSKQSFHLCTENHEGLKSMCRSIQAWMRGFVFHHCCRGKCQFLVRLAYQAVETYLTVWSNYVPFFWSSVKHCSFMLLCSNVVNSKLGPTFRALKCSPAVQSMVQKKRQVLQEDTNAISNGWMINHRGSHFFRCIEALPLVSLHYMPVRVGFHWAQNQPTRNSSSSPCFRTSALLKLWYSKSMLLHLLLLCVLEYLRDAPLKYSGRMWRVCGNDQM